MWQWQKDSAQCFLHMLVLVFETRMPTDCPGFGLLSVNDDARGETAFVGTAPQRYLFRVAQQARYKTLSPLTLRTAYGACEEALRRVYRLRLHDQLQMLWYLLCSNTVREMDRPAARRKVNSGAGPVTV